MHHPTLLLREVYAYPVGEQHLQVGSMPPHRIGFPPRRSAGYGLRRQLIDRDRNRRACWAWANERVCKPTGSSWFLDRKETVRHIYDLFVTQGNTKRETMEVLNRHGVLGECSNDSTGLLNPLRWWSLQPVPLLADFLVVRTAPCLLISKTSFSFIFPGLISLDEGVGYLQQLS